MKGLARQGALYLDAVRRMTPRQVAARLARRARTRLLYPYFGERLYPSPPPLSAEPADPGALFFDAPPFAEAALARALPEGALRAEAAELGRRRFAFLNLPPAALGEPVTWGADPHGSRLWQYHLHYGEWALTLAHAALLGSAEADAAATLRALLDDWIVHNPPARAPGWEPYPVARRLTAWTRLRPLFARDAAGRAFWRARLEPSLRRQARFLLRNLEHDVPNNHLLADYRALAWAGLCCAAWPDSRELRRVGLAGVWREMRRQVLADGVHAERSVSYHTIVLQDLLECRLLARARGVAVPEDVDATLAAMLDFLAALRTPDGSWPMVNDSVPGYPLDPRAALRAAGAVFDRADWRAAGHGGDPAYAVWLTGEAPSPGDAPYVPPRHAVFPDAGYAVLRDGAGGYLFFDAGPLGPRAVPGHGHADALSFVLHGGGRPLVVDPGTETYERGPARDRLRSAAAHNTVTVDGAEPCLFWGPFRVAYPPPARLLGWSESHVEGEHDGYRRLPQPVRHRRRVDCRGPGVWEVTDRFFGAGEHRFDLALQLAPDADLTVDGSGGEARFPGGVRLRIRRLAGPDGAAARCEPGSVATGWNATRPAPRFVLSWTAPISKTVSCDHRLLLEVAT